MSFLGEEAKINLRFAKRERPEEARWRCGKRDSIRSLERPDEKLTEIRVDRVRLIAAGGDDAYACARTTVA